MKYVRKFLGVLVFYNILCSNPRKLSIRKNSKNLSSYSLRTNCLEVSKNNLVLKLQTVDHRGLLPRAILLLGYLYHETTTTNAGDQIRCNCKFFFSHKIQCYYVK